MPDDQADSKRIFSPELYRRVLITVLAAVAIMVILFLASRIWEIHSHVDTDVTAHQLQTEQVNLHTEIKVSESASQKSTNRIVSRLDILTLEIKGQRKNLDKALVIVEKYKRKVDSTLIRGRASREVGVDRTGKNKVYVNIFSNASFLKHGDEIEIVGTRKIVRATVAGKILNSKVPDILILMNTDTAEEFGLSTIRGVTDENEIGIRLVFEDSETD